MVHALIFVGCLVSSVHSFTLVVKTTSTVGKNRIPILLRRSIPTLARQQQCLLQASSDERISENASTSSDEEGALIDNGNQDQDHDQDRTLGLLVLSTVPLVWGTYVPVVRSMYELTPPLPGLVFSAAYLLVASLVSMASLGAAGQWNASDEKADDTSSGRNDRQDASNALPVLAGLELGSYTFLANSLQVVGLKTVDSDRAGFLIQCE